MSGWLDSFKSLMRSMMGSVGSQKHKQCVWKFINVRTYVAFRNENMTVKPKRWSAAHQ